MVLIKPLVVYKFIGIKDFSYEKIPMEYMTLSFDS